MVARSTHKPASRAPHLPLPFLTLDLRWSTSARRRLQGGRARAGRRLRPFWFLRKWLTSCMLVSNLICHAEMFLRLTIDACMVNWKLPWMRVKVTTMMKGSLLLFLKAECQCASCDLFENGCFPHACLSKKLQPGQLNHWIEMMSCHSLHWMRESLVKTILVWMLSVFCYQKKSMLLLILFWNLWTIWNSMIDS